MFISVTECYDGQYGYMCNMPCFCAEGIKCDHLTGRCLCPPGLTGEKCDEGTESKYLSEEAKLCSKFSSSRIQINIPFAFMQLARRESLVSTVSSLVSVKMEPIVTISQGSACVQEAGLVPPAHCHRVSNTHLTINYALSAQCSNSSSSLNTGYTQSRSNWM